MSYKYGVHLPGQSNPSFNAVVYATRDEADAGGRELLSRWFMPTGYEVVETDEPATYRITDGWTSERIAT